MSTVEQRLSDDQSEALAKILAWLGTGVSTLTLGGLAGTGKTTLIKEILRLAPDSSEIAVVAFTGKAVSVLISKGVARAMTVHALIYRVCGENEKKEPIFSRRNEIRPSLVIVDEASMVNSRMHSDLECLANKILYVGDHGQLPPIGGDPKLMEYPEIRLEKIHRQAEDSMVIAFAHAVREGVDPFDLGLPRSPTRKEDKENGRKTLHIDGVSIGNIWPDDIHMYDAVLCGYNSTRHYLNKHIRESRGFSGTLPQPGETLICINNHRVFGLYNGQQVCVVSCTHVCEDSANLVYTDLQGGVESAVLMYTPQLHSPETFSVDEDIREGFGLFEWGYVLTVHKSQGSEWGSVCVVEQTQKQWDIARWRYTAASRAVHKLHYVIERRSIPKNAPRDN